MRGGGVPYCPWWGEHGVSLFDEPLWAGGCCCSSHYVVVPALKDCTPDLRRGVVAVCSCGRESGVRRPAARRAVSRVGAVACSHCSGWFGSAGWSLSAGAQRRRMVPRRVTLVSVSCVRAWPHSLGGIQTSLPWACWRARQSSRSTMASWRPLAGVVRSWRALTVSLVQLSCRLYQPGGLLRAVPWRVARRRSGSRMVVGVRRECSAGSRGGLAGWAGGVLRIRVHEWVALGGFGLAGRCRVASWVRGGLWGAMGGCGWGVLRWGPAAFWGALVVSWRPVDGDWGGVWGAEQVSGLLGHARHGNG